ncbi:Hypothetical_protein [Hexamita inflata]|uniref:Hypothetical_protein n=1 Tax=Hexamita inflata TaxID=28002 RepID=A0AA86P8L4_9EUKA|nr:Hypothetical protein HINF_LOCUS2779 [Hexamita inflata]CAI9933991.1 Hypothetical protein HINF_LOCUS21636 [Hexamita inflata]
MLQTNALNIKITYTVIIMIVFSVGLFFSFDVLITSSQFLPNKVDTSQLWMNVLYNDTLHAEVHTKVTNINLDRAYHHPQSTCLFDWIDGSIVTYYYLANNRTIRVYGSDDKKYHTINCLSDNYIFLHQKQLITAYNTSLALSIVGVIIPVVLISFILLFCTNWCKFQVSFNKDKYGKIDEEIQEVIRY